MQISTTDLSKWLSMQIGFVILWAQDIGGTKASRKESLNHVLVIKMCDGRLFRNTGRVL